MAIVLKKIAEKDSQEVTDNQPENNSIKTYNKEPQPKVAVPQTRVESTKPEQEIYPQLIVKRPKEAVVESLKRPIPNYTPQDKEEMPAQNTRSRKHIQRTIIQESILSEMEITSSAPTARQCTSINLPRKLLCDLSNAVVDASEEILQYRHLMARTKYRFVWGKDHAKE